MRVTSKGQVTIPIAFRDALGIDQDTNIEFRLEGNVIEIRKVDGSSPRSQRILGRLRAAPYTGPSTDELMALTRGEQ